MKSSKAKPSSWIEPSEPKAIRNLTLACPPKPVKACLATTQPPEPLLVELRPAQPIDWPPTRPSRELSLYQLFGSPTRPTTCQLVPPLMEDCSTAPSQLNSEFHHTFNSTL